jgi:hypothetical protein
MSGVGGLFIWGREAAAWFGGLAIPSKLTVVTIAFATASVGVAVVAPDVLPISPFTSSHGGTVVAPASTAKPPAPVNPSIVASAKPTTSARTAMPTVAPTTQPASGAPTMPGAGESKESSSATSKSTKAATTKKATSSTRASATPSSVYYKNCEAAVKAGATPLHIGQPGYRAALDPDGDGVACDKKS